MPPSRPGGACAYNGRVPVGNWLVLLVALAVVALDVSVTAPWTGLPVFIGMLLVVLAVAERTRQLVAGRRTAPALGGAAGSLGGVLWFEGMLLVALVGFAVARGLLVWHMFDPDGVDAAGRDAAAQTYDLVFTVLAGFAGGLVIAPEKTGRVLLHLAQRPGALLAGSFAAMIAIGSLLLTLPLSVTGLGHVSYVDSLFTMASAVCVTGLTVNDVSTAYTTFGHGVILAGIQLGGIGIMTIAALALAFSRNTSLQSQLRYAAMLDARTLSDLRRLVVGIIAGTFIIEALGAGALYFMFLGDPRIGESSPLWMAVFHAISAFCNGGFSLFPNSMTPFLGDNGVQAVIMLLVVLGGLGFPVMMEIVGTAWRRLVRLVRRRAPMPPRLSLTTRVVVATSLVLIAVGTGAIMVLEFTGALSPAADVGYTGRFMAALFASVNTRSGGWNTVDVAAMRDATLIVMCVLMFIGGSPASVAGGIKTTTAAVVFATLRGELRGHEPELGGRAIAPEALRKAIAVTVMSAGIILTVILLLTLTEDQPFMRLAFEAVSAYATVGLSAGASASLTVAGKLIITAAMFIGRVGPFTIALAVASGEAKAHRYRLAREDLPVG
jgi:trk system potassium uptake protein TrkH